MRRNQIAKLPQYAEFGCGWFGLSFFHLCRVAELKSHANHFFFCFSQDSYGMAVERIQLKASFKIAMAFLPMAISGCIERGTGFATPV
jgi:hypothetical protein